jgi:hypothetical protein
LTLKTILKLSYQICKTLLHLPEPADAQPEEEGDEGKAESETGPVDWAITAEYAPAEAVDHPHHRIKAVEEPPLLRDDLTAEADRGDIQAKLHNEGDHIAEISIFHVERSDPQARGPG